MSRYTHILSPDLFQRIADDPELRPYLQLSEWTEQMNREERIRAMDEAIAKDDRLDEKQKEVARSYARLNRHQRREAHAKAKKLARAEAKKAVRRG